MHEPQGRSWQRPLVAILIALPAAMVIWIGSPYNDFLLRNTHVSDGYVPLGAFFFILLLVALVNPLLRRLRPSLALTRGQLALIVGVLLVASVIPDNGLMRRLPYSIAAVPIETQKDPILAEEEHKMGLDVLPLFPDQLGYGEPAPAAEAFVGELLPGEPLPWSAWAGPLWSWGSLILFGWLMMIGLSIVVMPQWRDRERLAFPLLTVQEALIGEPEAGRLFPPLFRRKAFWIAVAGVMFVRTLGGLNNYMPERVPEIPLRWDLQDLFTEGPWVNTPWFLQQGTLYIVLAAVAYFMPNRISFSFWAFQIIYAAYWIITASYFPPYQHGTVREQRLGALVALAVGIVYLSRRRWGEVFASFFRRRADPGAAGDRLGGGMLLVGCAGIFTWLLVVGVQAGFALLFTGFAVTTSLVISRVVAESGMPFVKIRSELLRVVRLFPVKVIGAASLYFGVVMGILFTTTTQVSAAVMSTHAMALRENAGGRRGPTALLLLGVLVLGLLVGGAAHLNLNYHFSSSLDGEEQPVNSPEGYMWIGDAFWGVTDLRSGQVEEPGYPRHAHVVLGAAMAATLFVLCMAMPRWPLHPIGMLMIGSIMGGIMWPSLFVGWAVKKLIIKYGGAQMYRRGQAFFLGLIIGEVLATVVWTIVPIVLVACHQPFHRPPVFMPTRTA